MSAAEDTSSKSQAGSQASGPVEPEATGTPFPLVGLPEESVEGLQYLQGEFEKHKDELKQAAARARCSCSGGSCAPVSHPAPAANEDAYPCGITWEQAAGKPETSAALEQLPEEVRFPDDFPEPIRYDPAAKRLIYRGFMTNGSYRYLHRLSPDLAYVAALDEVNIRSAYTMGLYSDAKSRWPWVLGVGVVVLGAVVAWLLW